jgi:adenylate cyclase
LNDSLKAYSGDKLAVLDELHRALDSGLDGASERQRNLLSYLVTEELEGRGARIKAYSIATQALGRSSDFDPQLDSIVRVEIGRLRQTLQRYYLKEGRNAAVVISIPKGQYRPIFTPTPAVGDSQPSPEGRGSRRRAGALALTLLLCGIISFGAVKLTVPPARSGGAGLRGPVVAIAPFEFFSDKGGQEFVAGGLQADLADVLSGYQWLTVIPLNDENALKARLRRRHRAPGLHRAGGAPTDRRPGEGDRAAARRAHRRRSLDEWL